ncbi:NUDIX domain-containing protein [Streptomyces sp. 3MP-14]|uniref:NUDIX domain-containing protein n=1 Tax=Streptomyces mimosae TaxID=2586635 RepID=A0A5N6AM65_9ACTN|nr:MULTISPECIES: NUDIX domain-containing protein [Streptomyces]KAB8169937.1 NUDIX domain-containing protein [Streptomyces mimosae]KAB8178685.1 NUDIX domain-containing protein [Streptomyces sp. 3MP-14]
MKRIVARLWKLLRGPLQWRLLWLTHATFMVGVTGVVRNENGQVLLLRHRMWPADRPWGLPTGYAVRGEEFPMTVVREVREETGLDVVPGRLVQVTSGYRLRVEIAYEALHVGGTLAIDGFEILEAKWFSPDALPKGTQESHIPLIRSESLPGRGSPPTSP